MDMKTELMKTIAVGEGVCLMFKNGREITGVVSRYDDELMAIVLADGQRKLISYSLIGYFEKAEADVSATPAFLEYERLISEADGTVPSMDELLTRLKDESAAIYKICESRLESFRYAVKIRETGAKHGRSLPVINFLRSATEQYPQQSNTLLSLLMRVVLETGEKEYAKEYAGFAALHIIRSDLVKNDKDRSGTAGSCEAGNEHIKMLAKLCIMSSCYGPLLACARRAATPGLPMFRALAAVLKSAGKKPALADLSELICDDNYKCLIDSVASLPTEECGYEDILMQEMPEAAVQARDAKSEAVPGQKTGRVPEKANVPKLNSSGSGATASGGKGAKQRPAKEITAAAAAGESAREADSEETGLIQYYNPSGKYGIIRSNRGGTIKFLLRNVNDTVLAELLENQGNYKGKHVAYRIIQYVDKKGVKKDGAAQIRSIGADKQDDSFSDIFRKANLLFSSGKSNDSEALKLYLSVFGSGTNREVAARNIVSIYMRSGQPQEAEDFLIRHRECFGEEQFYTFLYQIYMQLDDAEKAASAADSIINITARPTSKLHYLFQQAKLYFRSERYGDATDACEQWLNFRHSKARELQGQTVSLEYGRKQICLLAARCIVKLKETVPGYEPSRRLLDYISDDDDAQELLSLNAGDENAAGINYGDYRNYISPIAQKLLNECVLSECGVDNRRLSPGEGKYTGSLKEAKAQAASLVKASTTQKPFVRFRNCLGAARVIYDALNNKESMTEMQDVVMETELEDMFFGSLAKALVSLGDDMIGRNDVEIDVARYYYLESLKYSRVDEQDKQNAITRCVLSLFTDRAQIPLTMQRDTDNLSVQQDLARYLNKTDRLSYDRLIYTITRIINSALSNQTKSILGQLTSGVLKSVHAKQLLNKAKELLDTDNGSGSGVAGFEDAILKLHSRYKRAEKDFLHIVERLKAITFAPLWLQEIHDDMQQFTSFFPFMDDLDQKRCRIISGLLARAREYNLFESFGLKENCLRSILSQLDELEASIAELPAKYSYEYLLPAVRNWRAVTAGVLNELYLSRKPKINCQIIENNGLHLYDGDCVYVHIYISNESDRQTADSLTVKLPDKEEYTVMSHLERRYYIKEGDAQTIRVRLKLNDPAIKAFSVDTLVEYEYKITENETERKEEKFENSVILGDFTFTELENPYFAYVSSGIVDKEEMVFGRADFIDGIITALKGDGVTPLRRKTIALYGQKRTGKSTVLYHLERKIRKEISTAVVVSLGDISKWRPKNFETRLYREIFKSIGTELARNHGALLAEMEARGLKVPDYEEIDDEDKGRELISDFFTEFNNIINENEAFRRYNVVILLDEYTNIYIGLCKNKIDADFMKYWKAVINDFGLVAIVVGQDYMMDFVNAYPNPFGAIDKRPLSYLPLNEAERMIVRPPVSDESKRAVFDGPAGERAVKKILELTAGSAFFIMILMDRLIGYLNEAKQPYVTDADIDRLVADNLLSGNYSLDLAKFESLYYDDGDVSDVSRPRHNVAVLWTISKQLHDFSRCRRDDILIPDKITSRSEMPKERIDELIARLVARDVLNVDRDGNYTIKVGLFNEWLYHNCSADTINSIPDVK